MNEMLDYKVYDSKAVMPYQRELGGRHFYDTVIGHEDEFYKTNKTKRGRPRKAKHLPYL
jgi:hypothetical protein